MNQKQLARRAGLSRGYLSRLERGIFTEPSAAIVWRLADALGTSMDALWAGEIRKIGEDRS